jgi:pyruvate/2-oxoglutarate dehydrogenase complex dihydrolipoamide acyltransferase (E2) component
MVAGTGAAIAVMTRIVRIMAGDASALYPLAQSPSPSPSPLLRSLIPLEHPSEAAAAAAAAATAAADAAAAAAAANYINGAGFFKPVPPSLRSPGCDDWQILDEQQQQHHHQVLSFRTGWARGLRIVPMMRSFPTAAAAAAGGGVDGEFDDGSEEFAAVVWNDLGEVREEIVQLSVGHG